MLIILLPIGGPLLPMTSCNPWESITAICCGTWLLHPAPVRRWVCECLCVWCMYKWINFGFCQVWLRCFLINGWRLERHQWFPESLFQQVHGWWKVCCVICKGQQSLKTAGRPSSSSLQNGPQVLCERSTQKFATARLQGGSPWKLIVLINTHTALIPTVSIKGFLVVVKDSEWVKLKKVTYISMVSLVIVIFTNTALFSCLFPTKMCCWLSNSVLSVWIWKSHRIFAQSF